MTIEPATRRANFWLFLGLVVFAVVLCALVLAWMRTRTHEQGGRVYPPVTIYFICHPEWSVTESKDLPAHGSESSVSADGRKVLRLRYTPLRMTDKVNRWLKLCLSPRLILSPDRHLIL